MPMPGKKTVSRVQMRTKKYAKKKGFSLEGKNTKDRNTIASAAKKIRGGPRNLIR
tara:strand:+ start:879 stop:1043 length:165 start_codon:yes stop_codon:yes gene_type:complete